MKVASGSDSHTVPAMSGADLDGRDRAHLHDLALRLMGVPGKDHLSQTELAVRAVQRVRPDMTASDARAAVNLVRRT